MPYPFRPEVAICAALAVDAGRIVAAADADAATLVCAPRVQTLPPVSDRLIVVALLRLAITVAFWENGA